MDGEVELDVPAASAVTAAAVVIAAAAVAAAAVLRGPGCPLRRAPTVRPLLQREARLDEPVGPVSTEDAVSPSGVCAAAARLRGVRGPGSVR